jgi:hypothetical protein
MPTTRTLTAAFDYFGARATNVRWGWAAESPDGSVVVITLWSDQIMRDGAVLRYSTGDRADLPNWVRRPGNRDRKKKLQHAIDHCSRLFRAVIVEAVDPAADVRTTRKQYRAAENLVMKIETFDPVTGEFTARSV